MEFEIHLECCLSLARRSLSIPYQDGCERSDQVFASPSFSSFLFLFRFVVCFSSTVGSRPNRFRENKHSKTDCHVEFRVGFPNANRILDKETSNFGPQKMRFLRVTQLKSLVPPPTTWCAIFLCYRRLRRVGGATYLKGSRNQMKNRRGKQRTERTSKHREDYWGRNSTKPLRKGGGE